MAGPESILLQYYDEQLATWGDSAAGAGWPSAADRIRRFDVALDLVCQLMDGQPAEICDLGCGTGELLNRIQARSLKHLRYIGSDLSEAALSYARVKFPDIPFHQLNVCNCSAEELEPLRCDVLIANGLFTVRAGMSETEMWSFMTDTLNAIWPLVRRGIVFNVMSKIVDWEREDLFHVSYDRLANFLHSLAGRAIGFRADYGLYEYMAYAVKPQTPAAKAISQQSAANECISKVPVFQASLPPAEHLLPYLKVLDRTRHYSNHGVLARRLRARLAETIGIETNQIVTASSGTSALVGAILASAGRASPGRPLAICPAYTFIGTTSAIEQCGYQIRFVDVASENGILQPEMALTHEELGSVGLVVVVAAYGRKLAMAPWLAFEKRTGIPVVVDGAAGLERLFAGDCDWPSAIPLAVSFHATKAFGTGEGGAVICTDRVRTAAIERALNFGFLGQRISVGPSINGKMSEYHAAVGLAELDGWPYKSAAFRRTAECYRREALHADLGSRIVVAPDIASCYVLFRANDEDEAEAVRRNLDEALIEYRYWYGKGVNCEPYFLDRIGADCPVTAELSWRWMGLPMASDLDDSVVRRIITAVAAAVHGQRKRAAM